MKEVDEDEEENEDEGEAIPGPVPASELATNGEENIPIDRGLFRRWAKESATRKAEIERLHNDGVIDRETTDFLIDKAIRPFYYFQEDQEEITPNQFKTIVKEIRKLESRNRFINWAKEKDIGIEGRDPLDIVADLSKTEASEFLDLIFK